VCRALADSAASEGSFFSSVFCGPFTSTGCRKREFFWSKHFWVCLLATVTLWQAPSNSAYAEYLEISYFRHFFQSYIRHIRHHILYLYGYAANEVSKLNCLLCKIPSRDKSDNSRRYSSFSHPRTEKSDSTAAVFGNAVAIPPQKSLRDINLSPTIFHSSSNPVKSLQSNQTQLG
jgi:hypothetical protein